MRGLGRLGPWFGPLDGSTNSENSTKLLITVNYFWRHAFRRLCAVVLFLNQPLTAGGWTFHLSRFPFSEGRGPMQDLIPCPEMLFYFEALSLRNLFRLHPPTQPAVGVIESLRQPTNQPTSRNGHDQAFGLQPSKIGLFGEFLQSEIAALRNAAAMVNEFLRNNAPVSPENVNRLHAMASEGLVFPSIEDSRPKAKFPESFRGQWRDGRHPLVSLQMLLGPKKEAVIVRDICPPDEWKEFPSGFHVEAKMAEFFNWMHNSHISDQFDFASEVYAHLVKIHPYMDANDRTAWLLLNWIRLRANLPPFYVSQENRLSYRSLGDCVMGHPLVDAIELAKDGFRLFIEMDQERRLKTTIYDSWPIWVSAETPLAVKQGLRRRVRENMSSIEFNEMTGTPDVSAFSESFHRRLHKVVRHWLVYVEGVFDPKGAATFIVLSASLNFVMNELLKNAMDAVISSCKGFGWVRLRITEEPDQIVIAITNTENAIRGLDEFGHPLSERIVTGNKFREGGSGIGVVWASVIVEYYGGWLRYFPDGSQLTVVISLPRTALASRSPQSLLRKAA